ncbi:SRPBCC family protein [Nocardioides sp. CFH 31398]|uniref:SRPBCC family protein n=1 Tax=Nocardioides sp. CFH 31398 TaxID=2919579 RepID=UPI001F054C87|nr:SRPBCC family protein [Nocardioides sp. CFH 31398]MCH1864916.1 SRPBCC family protein [Nocardioides sp. CFH 31398]
MSSDERIVSETASIAAPPATVFAILADPHQHERIDGSGSVKGNVKGPRVLSKGAKFGVDMKMFGLPYKIRNVVVEYEQDRRIAWRHFGAHRWRYEITPTDGGCEVTETWDASRYPTPIWLGLKAAGFPARNKQGIAGTLVKLREAAERDA